MQFLMSVKRAKHRTFQLRKKIGSAMREAADSLRVLRSRRLGYEYSARRYYADVNGLRFPNSSTLEVDHTLHVPKRLGHVDLAPAPRNIYCFWTGVNELTAARVRSLEHIRRVNPEFDVYLVTPTNLRDFELASDPIHPAYKYLSLVHRSDYLRAYFMHHYGGVYLDIKEFNGSWEDLLVRLNQAPDAWAAGPPELGAYNVGSAFGKLGRDQRLHYARQLQQGGFICKARSPFTEEWMAEVSRRLNYFEDLLPSREDDVLGNQPDYPISWYVIHGMVFGPLCLKYSERLIIDPSISVCLDGYR